MVYLLLLLLLLKLKLKMKLTFLFFWGGEGLNFDGGWIGWAGIWDDVAKSKWKWGGNWGENWRFQFNWLKFGRKWWKFGRNWIIDV